MEPPLLMALFHPYQLLSHRKVHLHFPKLYSDQKLVIGVDLRKKIYDQWTSKVPKRRGNCAKLSYSCFLLHDVNNVCLFGPQTIMHPRISWCPFEKHIVGLPSHGVRRSKWDPGICILKVLQMISDADDPDITLWESLTHFMANTI